MLFCFSICLKNKTNVLGIDAAPNAVLRALKHSIPTFPALFNFKTSKLVSNEFGNAKSDIFENVYMKPHANVYLASFM